MTTYPIDPADAVGLRRSVAVGLRIRQLRSACGWSQAALAERAGVPVDALRAAERGDVDLGIATLWRLAEALDFTLGAFAAGLPR